MLFSKVRYQQVIFIFLAAIVVHAVSLRNGFIYDDLAQILENKWLQDPAYIKEIFSLHVWGFSPDHPISNYYRPLMHTANLFVYTLFGPNPVFFHLLSVGLHLACCGMLYLSVAEVCCKFYPEDDDLGKSLPFLGTLIFAVYPANSEAVSWLGSSGDLLCAFFILSTLYFYLRMERRSRYSFWGFSVLAFFGAMLSKETAVMTVPVLIFIVDLSAGRMSSHNDRLAALLRYAPYALVGIIYLLVRVSVLGALIPLKKYTLDGFPFVVSAFQKFLWYIGKLIWPFTHNFYPELPAPVTFSVVELLLGALFFSLSLVALFFVAWRNKVLRVFSVLIFVPLFSAMQAYVLRTPVAERYLYIPSMGFCLILAWLILTYVKQIRIQTGLFVLLLIIWSGAAFSRNLDFVDSVTIWGDAAQKSSRSVEANTWYGKELFESGRIEEGIVQAKKVIALGSDDPGNIYKLAEGLIKLGRFHEAQSYCDELLLQYPDNAWVHVLRGRIFLSKGEVALAVTSLEYATREAPEEGVIFFWMGKAYEKSGNNAAARLAYQEAEKLLPANAPERIDLPRIREGSE